MRETKTSERKLLEMEQEDDLMGKSEGRNRKDEMCVWSVCLSSSSDFAPEIVAQTRILPAFDVPQGGGELIERETGNGGWSLMFELRYMQFKLFMISSRFHLLLHDPISLSSFPPLTHHSFPL